MEASDLEVSLGLEYEILVACPPLQAKGAYKQDAGTEPKISSYDWMELKRQCLLDLESELGRLIDEEMEREETTGWTGTTLEELQRHQRNIKFISPDRMENINATQLAIARSLQSKGLPVCYTIGNPLDGLDGQSFDLYHFLSKPEQIDTRIPEWANCFCVETDSTVLPKPADMYDKNEFEWAPIEVSTPVFRGNPSSAGSSEIQKLCATLRDEFLSWVNRSYDLHVHVSPADGPLDLRTAKKLVVIVWLAEPALYALAELNQNKRDDFHHKPITTHSMIARHDGRDGPAKNMAEAASLLPTALHGFLQAPAHDDAYSAYQLARVCDATDIPGLRRMILGTNQQRLGINFREFDASSSSPSSSSSKVVKVSENRRPYSAAAIEFRFFTPTRDPEYSRMCIKVAAAIFAAAARPDHDAYRRKLAEMLDRVGRRADRWRELLDVLGLAAEVPAWENAKRQHSVDPKDLEV